MALSINGNFGPHAQNNPGDYGRNAAANYFQKLEEARNFSGLQAVFQATVRHSPEDIAVGDDAYYANLKGFAEKVIDRYDANHDGGVNFKEYEAGVREDLGIHAKPDELFSLTRFQSSQKDFGSKTLDHLWNPKLLVQKLKGFVNKGLDYFWTAKLLTQKLKVQRSMFRIMDRNENQLLEPYEIAAHLIYADDSANLLAQAIEKQAGDEDQQSLASAKNLKQNYPSQLDAQVTGTEQLVADEGYENFSSLVERILDDVIRQHGLFSRFRPN